MPKKLFIDYEGAVSARDACLERVDNFNGIAQNPLPPIDLKHEVGQFLLGVAVGGVLTALLIFLTYNGGR